jgi:TRAP-type mannitol/chloroaromatic compound transport system substrate-binding protein
MLFVNLKQWEALPKHYKAILEAACTATWTTHCAKYDVINSGGLRQLVAAGAQLRFFSKPLMDAAYEAAFKTFDELKERSPEFAKIYPAWKKHMDDNELYFRVGEATYDNFIYEKRVRG